KDHRVDGRRIDSVRCPVVVAQLLVALEETAVGQHALAIGLEPVARSGDATGGTEELQRWAGSRSHDELRCWQEVMADSGHTSDADRAGRVACSRSNQLDDVIDLGLSGDHFSLCVVVVEQPGDAHLTDGFPAKARPDIPGTAV